MLGSTALFARVGVCGTARIDARVAHLLAEHIASA